MLLPDDGASAATSRSRPRAPAQQTPKAVRQQGLPGARTCAPGDGAHYQLLAYPLQRKAQLRKTFTDGSVEYLRIAKNVKTIRASTRRTSCGCAPSTSPPGRDKGHCRILAYVGKVLVADFTDRAAGDLQGRASGFAVGATKNAKGAAASFDDVVVRVPNPF